MNAKQVRVAGGALLSAMAALVPALLTAQTPESIIRLDPLIVNAERISTPLSESIAAVSVLTREDLSRLPNASLADAFRQIPGFALVDQDGSGRDPQVISRGFYGGGEAEYVVVLLDGRPLNDVQTGLVRWDAIPLASVDRVEILHGGSSALWGDAAIGGVVNIITRGTSGPSFVGWETAFGSNGSWRGAADASGVMGGRNWSLYGGADRTEGFREHSERVSARVGGQLELISGSAGRLRFAASADLRDFDEPGALSESAMESDPSSSSVYHRFDATHDQGLRGDLIWDRPIGTHATFTATAFGEKRESEAVRTLVIAPFFADTKERVLDSSRAGLSAQLAMGGDPLEIGGRLLLGVDLSNSTLDSRYYRVAMGGQGAYESASGVRGDLDASGEGDRRAVAAFAHYQVLPHEKIRFTLGVRSDWIDDSFRPSGGSEVRSSHSAVSPRVGVNVNYLSRGDQSGNFYLSAGRSFKAPTLDQLFDQRSIPVNFPPFSIIISNNELSPQRGKSIEGGIYHNVVLGQGRVGGTFALSAYRMDMVDELDFNVESFRYVNIGESRHDGIELGFRLREVRRGSTAFVNYTIQDATDRSPGSTEGNQLKAIPRHSLSVGGSTVPVGLLEVGLVASRQSGIFLDDANTVELPAYTRVDARLAYPIAGASLSFNVRNLFDSEYSTTGFPDPSGIGGMYYRPAAGRTFEIGVRGAR